MDGATDAFDPSMDASSRMRSDNKPRVFSVCQGQLLSYNTYPKLDNSESREVDLGIIGLRGDYMLVFNDIETINAEVYLYDQSLQVKLPISSNTKYAFHFDPVNDIDRFKILFTKHEGVVTNIPDAHFSESLIKIYPNPSKELLTIEILEPINNDQITMKVFDILGQQMLSCDLKGAITKVDVSNLSPGSYLIRTQIGDKINHSSFKIE